MSTTTPIQPPRAITSRAAENGLVISGCICLLLLFCGLATVQPVACLLLWAGTLAMPVVIYRLLARSYRQGRCTFGFAEIWAEGIASFFLGSLVPAAVAYLLLRFAFPDFIAIQMESTIEAFKSLGTPEGDQWAKTLTDIRAKAPLPTAADIAANLISFNIVVGTALSLLVTPLVKIRNRCKGCSDDCNNK